MQIGFTSLVENRVASSQEKIFRQDCVKRHIVESSSRRSRRIEKQVEGERNRKGKKEIEVRSSGVNTIIKFIAVLAHILMRVR